jgi:hypothetical protein
MKSDVKTVRCIHCLKLTEAPEADHVFPDSWYPDSTPPTVQRWTAPSCPECNRKLGQLEKDLLIRLVLGTDPNSDAASGLAAKVFRSLGLDVKGLPEKEKTIRDGLRATIHSEFIPYAEVAELSAGRIPGLGPSPDEAPGPAIFIPWAALAIIGEKIARGCEYKYKNRGRLVEPPYGIRTLIENSGVVPEPFASFGEVLDFGPGCKVIRGAVPEEDPGFVRYWISIWGTIHFTVLIDQEAYLQSIDKELRSPGGTLPPENRAMQIPHYLRSFNHEAPGQGWPGSV